MKMAILAAGLYLLVTLVIGRDFPRESRPVSSAPVVVVPPASTQVEGGGGVLNPYEGNPLHGRHVESSYKIFECSDLFGRRPNGGRHSLGYGKYFLRVESTLKVGADPEVVQFLEVWKARPGSVKPCSQKRDHSDCVCDQIAGVCYAEPEMIQYKGIKKGMQHEAFADPFSRVSEDSLFADFKSLCLRD